MTGAPYLPKSTASYLKPTLVTWTGAPGSPQRTWDEKDGAKPLERFDIRVEVPLPIE